MGTLYDVEKLSLEQLHQLAMRDPAHWQNVYDDEMRRRWRPTVRQRLRRAVGTVRAWMRRRGWLKPWPL